MAEITFANPEYLWFLISIPMLIIAHFLFLKRSRKKAMKFANFEALKRVTGKRIITKNISVLVLRVLILLSLVLAVSGPVLWYQGDTNRNDFVIMIDTSASMTTSDLQPSRLEAAKTQAINFIDTLDAGSKVGLVTFSGYTFVGEIPTQNHNKIKKSIEGVQIAQVSGTDIPGAIVTATNLLVDSPKGKTLIMISDGSNTIGSYLDESISRSIAYAQDQHVTIYTIGTGKEGESPIGYLPQYYNISSVFNEDTLKYISNSTGGEYFPATDNEQLTQAFKNISDEKARLWLNIALSFLLMFIALILLFIEWGLINTRFRKLP